MGLDMESSIATIPASFGPRPKNVFMGVQSYTAADWKLLPTVFAPIYLKNELPDENYDGYISLIEVVMQSCARSVTADDLTDIEENWRSFHTYYESHIYSRQWHRLHTCLSVVHQLLHVAEAISSSGPMSVYDQWSMERLCGTFTFLVASRVSVNRNLALTLLSLEQRHQLRFVLGYPKTDVVLSQIRIHLGQPDRDWIR